MFAAATIVAMQAGLSQIYAHYKAADRLCYLCSTELDVRVRFQLNVEAISHTTDGGSEQARTDTQLC